MSFFAKRYKQCVVTMFRGMRSWVWIVITLVFAFWFRGSRRRGSLIRFIVGAAFGAVLTVLFVLIASIFAARKDIKLYEVLDKYGFGLEYLKAYEQHRIIGKQFRLQYAAEYAEIFVNIGKPRDALNYLNAVVIPPNAPIEELVAFFYVYVTAALKTGNVSLAEEIWRRYEGMLMQARNSPQYRAVSVLTVLPLIYIDCCAGRIQRAYEQTVAFMNSKDYQECLSPTIDIDIIFF